MRTCWQTQKAELEHIPLFYGNVWLSHVELFPLDIYLNNCLHPVGIVLYPGDILLLPYIGVLLGDGILLVCIFLNNYPFQVDTFLYLEGTLFLSLVAYNIL